MFWSLPGEFARETVCEMQDACIHLPAIRKREGAEGGGGGSRLCHLTRLADWVWLQSLAK